MTARKAEPRSDRMYAHCSICEHTWIGMYLPMEMSKAARVMKRLSCPKCGETGKKLFMASKEQALAFEALEFAEPVSP